jgi:polyphosphate kinase 2 (PPK2 family)
MGHHDKEEKKEKSEKKSEKKIYEKELERLQLELVKMQYWIKSEGLEFAFCLKEGTLPVKAE